MNNATRISHTPTRTVPLVSRNRQRRLPLTRDCSRVNWKLLMRFAVDLPAAAPLSVTARGSRDHVARNTDRSPPAFSTRAARVWDARQQRGCVRCGGEQLLIASTWYFCFAGVVYHGDRYVVGVCSGCAALLCCRGILFGGQPKHAL